MSNPLRIAFYRTDRYGHPLGRLGFVSAASRDRTTTGTDTLDITCKTFCDKGDRILFKDSAGVAREYIITDFDQTRDNDMTLVYHCVNSISELGLHVIEDLRNRNASPAAMLGKALSGTRWIPGTVHAGSGGTKDLSFYHTTALKSVQDIADLFSLEIQTEIVMDSLNSTVLTRRISLLDRVGDTNPRRFSINHNLKGLERTIDSADVVTRLYGYGKGLEETDANGDPTGGYGRKISFADINGGKPYVENTAATQQWGIPDAHGNITPSMAVVDFSDEDDKQKLLAETRAKLAETSQPKVSYKATVAALGVEGVDRAGIGVGDAVHVIDTTFVPEIRVAGRVLEIKDNLIDPLADDTEITLGNLQDDYTQQSSDIQNTVNQLWQGVGMWNDAAGLRPSYIDGVINGLNSEMNKTGGYVYMEPGTGITVYNAPKNKNPTMAIQLGGGYFRIANSKKSDGSWNWRTMGTGSGLIADTLVAGTIHGGYNNLSYWNLETGYFQAENAQIGGVFRTGSGTNLIELIDGAIYGYEGNTYLGKIDFSAHSYNVDDGTKYQGIQMTARDIIRISSPLVAIAPTNNENTVATIAVNETISQPVVTQIKNTGDGRIEWHYGTFKLTICNGLVIGYSTSIPSAKTLDLESTDVRPTGIYKKIGIGLREKADLSKMGADEMVTVDYDDGSQKDMTVSEAPDLSKSNSFTISSEASEILSSLIGMSQKDPGGVKKLLALADQASSNSDVRSTK